ncbi:MAG: PAS domain S-box protein [Myxococcota bacterium]
MGKAVPADREQCRLWREASFLQAPVAMLLTDARGEVVDANRAGLQLLHRPRSEVLGKTLAELGVLGPAEAARVAQETATGGSIHDLPITLRHAEHPATEVLLSMECLDRDGARHASFSLIDVSDRRRAEARFQSVLEAAPDAMLVVDQGGHIEFTNAQVSNLFGYTKDELLGASIETLIPERYRDRHLHARAAYQGAPSYRPMGQGRELYALKKDHSECATEVSLAPLGGGEAPEFIAAVRDITQRKAVELRLATADRLNTVGTLAAGVAHEINNPLAFTMMNLELLNDELKGVLTTLPPERRTDLLEILRDARDGAERVRKIVANLKMFTQAGAAERRESLDVRHVLNTALHLTQNQIRHRARLVRDFGVTAPVSADEARLVQVFINLLLNAVYAIRVGDVANNEIRIRTEQTADRVIVEVQDSGEGIPPHVKPRIFEPFFTTKPAGVGTGLGLAISYNIVQGLGGDITVDSALGKGTTFRVSLPIAAAPEERPGPARKPDTSSRLRILVVDDDRDIGTALGRLLADHDVVLRTSAKDALELLRQDAAFDVVLCDLMMPDMTGMELEAVLAREFPALGAATLYMTGGAFTDAAKAFVASHSGRLIAKPFDAEGLMNAIGALLGSGAAGVAHE